MTIESHIESLNKKHSKLDAKLHEAYIHHLPTADLKKEKLRIKDELLKLEEQQAA